MAATCTYRLLCLLPSARIVTFMRWFSLLLACQSANHWNILIFRFFFFLLFKFMHAEFVLAIRTAEK
ncbi:hypothetical protein BDY21DRAFT_147571 [Lineolata rhizophorae]|uniref:Uncharacterized protein n=1 Tax=Lineolata rhizophorae TaxID=578093 RepID=A0A6A6NMG5_9PEZI|nr:hypothetical protein BDY21DRAFT_147571 [Lineolata rhizophorae]